MSEKTIPPDVIRSKVVGVFIVPERQEYLETVRDAEHVTLDLVAEPDNKYDKDAIKVMAVADGLRMHIGYVRNNAKQCLNCGAEYEPGTKAEECTDCKTPLVRFGLASELSYWMHRGCKFVASVLQVTGGNGRNIGCNIEIRRLDNPDGA